MRDTGLSQAQRIQAGAPDMTGTELYAEEQYIPDFQAAVALHNMLERKAGFVMPEYGWAAGEAAPAL